MITRGGTRIFVFAHTETGVGPGACRAVARGTGLKIMKYRADMIGAGARFRHHGQPTRTSRNRCGRGYKASKRHDVTSHSFKEECKWQRKRWIKFFDATSGVKRGENAGHGVVTDRR